MESRYRHVVALFSGHIDDIPGMKYAVSEGPSDRCLQYDEHSDEDEEVCSVGADYLSSDGGDSE